MIGVVGLKNISTFAPRLTQVITCLKRTKEFIDIMIQAK